MTVRMDVSETQGVAELSDAELVLRAKRGSEEAFGALVERYHGLVYVIALAHLRSPEAAEELAQEVFMRVFLHLPQLLEPGAFPGWIRRIARNESVRWLQRRQRHSELLPLVALEELGADVLPASSPTPRDRLSDAQESAALHEALVRLSASQREVVLLHYLEGQSKSEVARQLGLNPSTVGRQLERATTRLRQHLEPLVGDAVRSASPHGRGLGRTLAAVALLAGLPGAKRAVLAAQPAFSLPAVTSHAVATGKLSAAAHMIAGGIIAMGKWKAVAVAAAVAVGAGSTYVVTSHMGATRSAQNGLHAVIPDAEFKAALEGPAPSDYIVRIRQSPPVPMINSGGGGGSSHEGLKNLIEGQLMSNAYASVLGIPAWRVEQLPPKTPLIDVVVRTPRSPSPQAGLEAHVKQIWPAQRAAAGERFLQIAGWKVLPRKVSVPCIRLYSPASAPAASVKASSMPEVPENTPLVLPPRATHRGALHHSMTWKQTPSLDTVVDEGMCLHMDPYPKSIIVDEIVLKHPPVRPADNLKLISMAHPEKLAQQLSWVYDLPYEVTKDEVEVYLVYDPATASPTDIEAWKAGDPRVTDLR